MFGRFGRFNCASVARETPIDTNWFDKSWADQPSLVDHSSGEPIDTDLPTQLGFDGGFTSGIGF